jgi:soluble lytic murein transglycosylase-like protein
MIYGISGAPIKNADLYPFAGESNGVAFEANFPPAWLYAHAWQESIREDGAASATVISSDGGHGLMQLTSSYPDDWTDPRANLQYALSTFLYPAIDYWHGLYNYSGSVLMLLVAATYNEGLGAAKKWHSQGDVDGGTTNEYGHRIVATYGALISGAPLP